MPSVVRWYVWCVHVTAICMRLGAIIICFVEAAPSPGSMAVDRDVPVGD